MIRSLWKFLTSLRLTVVCLAIGIVLVFFGTLAQVDEGLWNAQARWFKSFFIWVGPAGANWKAPVFPGGYLLGVVLLLNLAAAHIKRFQWGWKKVGVHLTHAGVVLLLVGQLITDRASRESRMSLREGDTRSYSESHMETELVFASDSDGNREKVVSIPGKLVAKGGELTAPELPFTVRVTKYQPNSEMISRAGLAQAAGTVTTALATVESQYATPEGLPAQAERAQESERLATVWQAALKAIGEDPHGDLVAIAKRVAADPKRGPELCAELKTRFRSSMLTRLGQQKEFASQFAAERVGKGLPIAPESFPVLASKGAGPEVVVIDQPETNETDRANFPYALVEIASGGQKIGDWLVTPALDPQEVVAGGKTYRMAFRFERYYQPFSLTLLKATHEIYPGTITSANEQGIPKNFQSRVRIDNSETGESREVDIYMNNPLRYGGLTFYQYQMGQMEATNGALNTSTLQVVKNPGWLTPYFGCLVVGAGMLYQFGFHLFGFIRKRLAPARAAQPWPRGKSRDRRAEPVVS